MTWTIPRLWPGRTVAILAPGPSMSREVAAKVRARALPTIAVTSAAPLAPWADMIYAADEDFWRLNPQLMALEGLKVGMCDFPGVHQIAISRRTEARGEDRHNGFDPDPSKLRTGGNSGYQALSIALHAGATKILLFGFDMGGSHWHGDYAPPLRNTHPDQFAKWIDRFKQLAPILLAYRVDVVNCSPDSALECFRKLSPDEALCEQ